MKRAAWFVVLLVLVSCGESKDSSVYELSRSPISVRGWIYDVKGSKPGATVEMEVARRAEIFAAASVWVENNEYASGGISENGAFIVLDVPPGNATLGFNAPGAETARVVFQDVPGTADVFIPDLVLEPNGATVLDPSKILIRVPSDDVKVLTASGKTAKINQYTVPIMNAPLSQMTDRREYPNPGGFRPVATVK